MSAGTYQPTLAGAAQIVVAGRESAESASSASDALPCGHAPVYAESGTCLVCEQSFNTSEEFAVKRAAASDGRGGRL